MAYKIEQEHHKRLPILNNYNRLKMSCEYWAEKYFYRFFFDRKKVFTFTSMSSPDTLHEREMKKIFNRLKQLNIGMEDWMINNNLEKLNKSQLYLVMFEQFKENLFWLPCYVENGRMYDNFIEKDCQTLSLKCKIVFDFIIEEIDYNEIEHFSIKVLNKHLKDTIVLNGHLKDIFKQLRKYHLVRSTGAQPSNMFVEVVNTKLANYKKYPSSELKGFG